MIIFDNIKQTLTCLNICYLSGSDDPAKVYDDARNSVDTLVKDLGKPLVPKPADYVADTRLVPETPAQEYMAGVNTIKDHIVEGDIFQAVYSQPFSCKTDVDPVMIYRAQRYINPSPYMFFMNFTDRVIAGSSPETMVRLENRVATLRPIAGTRPGAKANKKTGPWPMICSMMKRRRPNTSCSLTLAGTTLAVWPGPARSR